MDLIRDGARFLFGGARRSKPALAGLGMAMIAAGWVRKLYRPDREMIYSRDLRHGETIRIRLLGADDPAEGEVEISG